MTIQEIIQALPDEIERDGDKFEFIVTKNRVMYFPLEENVPILFWEEIINGDLQTALEWFYQRFIDYYAK